jgi:hypothetical protein
MDCKIIKDGHISGLFLTPESSQDQIDIQSLIENKTSTYILRQHNGRVTFTPKY